MPINKDIEVNISVTMENKIIMYFEEEGCSSYSNRNIYATEVQKLELEYIKKVFREKGNQLQCCDDHFMIADFGTADGGGFIRILPNLVGLVRSYFGQERQISILFEDRPENDYKSIFRHISDITSDSHDAASLKDVFVVASGTSFYKQCVPDNTLSLVCSSTALHFLSVQPCFVETCFPLFSEKNLLFAKQGEKDFETFLVHRAKELKPGGLMVLFILGTDETGQYIGNTRGTNIFKTIADTWTEFSERDIITKDEVRKSTFSLILRTRKDIMKPFEKEDSPVKQSGLMLLSVDKVILESPSYDNLWSSCTENGNEMTVAQYADEMVSSIKTCTYNTFYNALDPSRRVEEKKEILLKLYKELYRLVRAEPLEYVMDYVYHSISIMKR